LIDQHHGGGGDVLARWDHTFSSHSQTSLQFYEMNFYHTDNDGTQRVNTVDFDFHHHLEVGSRHDIVWGLGYRYTTDRVAPALQYTLNPPAKSYGLYNLFVQDEIRLSDAVRFTVGSRFEHNAFTGFEIEPSARLAWAISDRQNLWFAASKAIRQPNRNDQGIDVDIYTFPLPNNQLGVGSLLGNLHFQDEQLRDYEAGYRVKAGRSISLDFTTFYSFYHNLVTAEPHAPFFEASPPPPHIDFPMFWENGMNGQNYGAEADLSWNVFPSWRLSGGYSWLKMNLHPKPTSRDPAATALEHESPQHQFNLRSYLNIRRNLFLDNSLYYVSSLPGFKVPAYARLDSRLAWRAGESLEFSIVGQNLLQSRHFEFGDIDEFIATRPERAVLGRITWSF
jgi:iron complex outermembrane recepter protein